jgi:glycosyltransferase involved in cell wall biosynthesis
MTKVSAFSFIHNAIAGGYPIVEAIFSVFDYVDEVVIADCQSDDGTRQLLEKIGIRVIDGQWGNEAGKTLKKAHALHTECENDIIIHFEADEVYSESLIQEVRKRIDFGANQLAVYRLQLEQNFQRCRWYPERVHRIFQKGTVSKEGHSTDYEGHLLEVPQNFGYLWDITNCFRDNWLKRNHQQANLWDEEPEYKQVPIHFMHSPLISNVDKFLNQPHWEWTTTPFSIPDCLRHLVGKTKYES